MSFNIILFSFLSIFSLFKQEERKQIFFFLFSFLSIFFLPFSLTIQPECKCSRTYKTKEERLEHSKNRSLPKNEVSLILIFIWSFWYFVHWCGFVVVCILGWGVLFLLICLECDFCFFIFIFVWSMCWPCCWFLWCLFCIAPFFSENLFTIIHFVILVLLLYFL